MSTIPAVPNDLSITYYTPAPKTRPWVDLLRAALCVVLFALIGVMLGLGV